MAVARSRCTAVAEPGAIRDSPPSLGPKSIHQRVLRAPPLQPTLDETTSYHSWHAPWPEPHSSPPDCEIVRGLLFPASPLAGCSDPRLPGDLFKHMSERGGLCSEPQCPQVHTEAPLRPSPRVCSPPPAMASFSPWNIPGCPTSAPSSPSCVQGPPQAPPAPFVTSFGSVSSGRCHRGLRVACLQTHPYPRSLSAP